MKKIFLTTFVLACALLAKGQNKISLPDFNHVEISSSSDIVLVADGSTYIELEDQQFDKTKLIPKVENGTLTWTYLDNEKPSGVIYIGVKQLSRLTVGGSGDVSTRNTIPAPEITIGKAGSGDLDLDLESNKITLNQSGVGDTKLEGTTNSFVLNKSGAGEIKGYELIARNVTANVSGPGTAKVYASDSLNANASGIGDILYIGKPKNVAVNIGGAGTVREVPFVEKASSDTTRLKVGRKKIIILDDDKIEVRKDSITRKPKVKDIFEGFEIGVNGYVNNSNSFEVDRAYDYLDLNYGKSINLNLNFAEGHIKLYRNYVALTYGAGLEFNRYFFRTSNMSLQPIKDTVRALPFAVSFKKNILKSTFITVPLLLELNTHSNPKKSFHLAVGGFVSLRMGGKLKQEYVYEGVEYRNKSGADYNLNFLKYGAMVRAGYGKFNVYATYGLSELFQPTAFGPVLHPVSVGVTLIPF